MEDNMPTMIQVTGYYTVTFLVLVAIALVIVH